MDSYLSILGISILQQERIQHITGTRRINLPIICTDQTLMLNKRSGISGTFTSLRSGK